MNSTPQWAPPATGYLPDQAVEGTALDAVLAAHPLRLPRYFPDGECREMFARLGIQFTDRGHYAFLDAELPPGWTVRRVDYRGIELRDADDVHLVDAVYVIGGSVPRTRLARDGYARLAQMWRSLPAWRRLFARPEHYQNSLSLAGYRRSR